VDTAMSARPRVRTAAALACLAVLAPAMMTAGCGSSRPGAAVPASAIPSLAAIARRAAKANDDPVPAQVTVVLTTHQKALTSATPGDTVPGTGGVRVYLLTMVGRFTAGGASIPSGATAPTGRYLSIVVDAKTFRVMDLGLSHRPPPVSPASLGPLTYLTGHRP